MFRDVPGNSGMFRNVPECSMFLVLSTAGLIVYLKLLISTQLLGLDWKQFLVDCRTFGTDDKELRWLTLTKKAVVRTFDAVSMTYTVFTLGPSMFSLITNETKLFTRPGCALLES